MHSPLSEADEETFYRQRTHERTLPCSHFEGRTLDPHARAHTHTLCLPTSKADKEKFKINERTIPRPHLNDIRWTQRGVGVCVCGKRLLVVVGSPTPNCIIGDIVPGPYPPRPPNCVMLVGLAYQRP